MLKRIRPKLRDLSRSRLIRAGGIGAAAAILVSAALYGFRSHLIDQAQQRMDKGYYALVAATLEPWKLLLVSSEKGCRLMIQAHLASKDGPGLELISQYCGDAGTEIPDIYIGMAMARQFKEDDRGALARLAEGASRFPDSPDLHYQMALAYKRLKEPDKAVSEYLKAFQLLPSDLEVAAEALAYLTGLGKWNEALPLAEFLARVQTPKLDIRLVAARVLKKVGKAEAAQAVVRDIEAMAKQDPSLEPAMRKHYPDLFEVTAPVPPAPKAKYRGRSSRPPH